MKNGLIENLTDLYNKLLKDSFISQKIHFYENKKIIIYYHNNFIVDIVYKNNLGLFSIYVNSIFLSDIEEQDIFEYILELTKESVIVQNKKFSFIKKPLIIISKNSFDLNKWKNKQNVKIFTSEETLIDNF